MLVGTEGGKRRCSRCVSDDTIPGIRFDENGVCNYCKVHDELDKQYPIGIEGQKKLMGIVEKIKRDGQKKEYDCIVGLSGGTDSTFCLKIVKELGLRPLAVHFDNGWNSKVSETNMNKAIKKFGVDLQVVSVNHEEFKDLQRSFLKASVPDAEIPTDIAIHSILHKKAVEKRIKWIINGMNFRTEGIQPLEWSYMDGKYVRSVQKIFGNRELMSYPNLTIMDMVQYSLIKGIKTVPILNYMDYDKEETKRVLQQELGWTDYDGHHFESLFTRFIITDILWKKFSIDKRKIQLSAVVRSGQLSREEALSRLETPPRSNENLAKIVIRILNISENEFNEILDLPPRTFRDYPTSYPVIRALKYPIRIACSFDLIPKIFYEKYLGAMD